MGNAFHTSVTEDIALCLCYIEIWLLDFTLYPLNVVSDDIRDKLIAKGIPAEEIAYIHDAKTEKQKADLFDKVRNGEIRVLLGSANCAPYGTIKAPVLRHLYAKNNFDFSILMIDIDNINHSRC